jgi:hypothetical protein
LKEVLKLLVLCAVILGAFYLFNKSHSEKCEAKGGTWLMREGMCLDIKKIE